MLRIDWKKVICNAFGVLAWEYDEHPEYWAIDLEWSVRDLVKMKIEIDKQAIQQLLYNLYL